MAKEQYQSFNFSDSSLDLIHTMDDIIEDYSAQGFTLTVRQLYYQLVARDIVPNTERSYKRITSIANDARLAGLIDWDAIEDRTRAFLRRQRWTNGAEILEAAAGSFHMDMWENQERRVFCIVEKEALVGVLERICSQFDVPVLAARGYPSCTVLREFAESDLNGVPQDCVILHLGDHDPSGIDMTRDLTERLQMFASDSSFDLRRIALNMPQIEERKPPPNPAKVTDSRFADYARRFGSESWELDALPPQYLVELVQGEILKHIDDEIWQQDRERVEDIQDRIREAAKSFR
jgi:hypothetical protein